MQTLVSPLKELNCLEEIGKKINIPGLSVVTGCLDGEKTHLAAGIHEICCPKKRALIVTYSDTRAQELLEEYRLYDGQAEIFPAKDVLFYQADVAGNLLTTRRIAALKQLKEQENGVLITTFDALMNTMAEPERVWDSVVTLREGNSIDPKAMAEKLLAMGYEREDQVSCRGRFAVRGGILDIFPLTEEMPVRIELWGDEIDTIRTFDVESQKSAERQKSLEIWPATELVLTEEEREKGLTAIRTEMEDTVKRLRKEMETEKAFRLKSMVGEWMLSWGELGESAGMDACLSYFCKKRSCLLDYLKPEKTCIFFDELSRCMEQGRATWEEFSMAMKGRLTEACALKKQLTELFSPEEITGRLGRCSAVTLNALDRKANGLTVLGQYSLDAAGVPSYNNAVELLLRDLEKYKKQGYRVILISGSHTRAKRLAQELLDAGLLAFYTEDPEHPLLPGQVMVCYGKCRRGFSYDLLRFAIISESDIFGREKTKKRKKIYSGDHIASFSDLSVGDYVVHENHGLGIYRGLEKIETDGKIKDYIKIEYAGGSSLYILATQLESIQKYAGKDAAGKGAKPKLNRLGGPEWNRTKTRVRGAVQSIASDLVKLYAQREKQKGFVCGPDTVWQQEFEELFPFEETEDQLAAIRDTKADMESGRIMDRLICGDVGYGKTEIAIRAAFKAAMEGKQVAYLAPTTILAQQIYNTFAQRMKDYPIRVDLLCRFRTPGEIRKSLADLKNGQVDILVGTHRILSKDVAFKDLGLLVVDEEQRFGVAHKEKIKQLKTNVDVLTLTATPIPRTLHMSLIGIRDMSVLEEPPMDRLPIQTYVMEYNEEMVREAIARELARGGQVYYVYNQVRTIPDMTAKLRQLLPEANIEFAHGQMHEKQLEDIMYRFINREIDVLVSTTIIETGLDISNCNTMIIHDADRMGLSQLYQLRGRVGRSSRSAYAFLMYRRDKMLKEVAEKRLAAIREYSALGSGFKIAMKDLEIRGAGNLLGAEQSGHMESVGYDLYCKMLHEAVAEAKGEETEAMPFETGIDIRIDAYIPADYIPNEAGRLEIYKRIAGITEEEAAEEMMDELIDRYGTPPKSVQNLLMVARLKTKAHACYLTEVSQKGDTLKLTLYGKAPVRVERIPDLVGRLAPRMKFTMDADHPFFTYLMRMNSRDPKPEAAEILKEILENMQILLDKKE